MSQRRNELNDHSGVPQDVDPRDAPVSIWLQGGPGASTLYGLLEINGPIRAVYNGSKATTGEWNPYSWSKGASMLYVDNPVGSGFSYSSFEGLPSGQPEVGEGLYEFLVQFFTLFPQYQPNDFYVFGESFAGDLVIINVKFPSQITQAGMISQESMCRLLRKRFMTRIRRATSR